MSILHVLVFISAPHKTLNDSVCEILKGTSSVRNTIMISWKVSKKLILPVDYAKKLTLVLKKHEYCCKLLFWGQSIIINAVSPSKFTALVLINVEYVTKSKNWWVLCKLAKTSCGSITKVPDEKSYFSWVQMWIPNKLQYAGLWRQTADNFLQRRPACVIQGLSQAQLVLHEKGISEAGVTSVCDPNTTCLW